MPSSLINRLRGKYQRLAANKLGRRPLNMKNQRPLISFTFDDFPVSAWTAGGRILEEHSARGTYFVSLGLTGKVAPTGLIIEKDRVPEIAQRGHEVGCHTFSHCHSFDTAASEFERQVLENQAALSRLIPGIQCRTLSYPISVPRPSTKVRCAQYFRGCRGGGQRYNTGTIDLNQIAALFIEQERDEPGKILECIDETCRNNGWLVLATHDVCDNPTEYGCTPELFETIVKHAAQSGAQVMTMGDALDAIEVKK